MKRDEKNLISRRKILDSALAEFGTQGYGMSSVNTICTAGDISKGILYHYFRDKDELYLACVQELFDSLTEHLTH
ncbi:MAG: TetR/AcrR family transcriptional regulator, partial [Oscillospiraceae bacterium]